MPFLFYYLDSLFQVTARIDFIPRCLTQKLFLLSNIETLPLYTTRKTNEMPPTYLKVIAGIIGIALIGSGLHGVFNPSHMARVFGVIDVSRDMTVFYPGIGGRNLSAGLAVWTMLLYGQYRAMGMFLLCWMCTGLADTYLLLIHYGEVDTVWLHVFNTCVLAVVAPKLLKG